MSAQDARVRVSTAELGRDWTMVRLHRERARSVSPDAGLAEAALVALSLDHAYQAFESMLVGLERILERAIDASEPAVLAVIDALAAPSDRGSD